MKKNVFVKKAFWSVGVLLMLGVGVAAYGVNQSGERADCPGKVTCPLTWEAVCKDQCPLVDVNREDCPGKVDCPLTGELVCRDECPLDAEGKTAETDEELPPCCRGRK